MTAEEIVRKLTEVFDFDGKKDPILNLEGAAYDLAHKFDPKDGGVCVSTIRRAVDQLVQARRLLENTHDRS